MPEPRDRRALLLGEDHLVLGEMTVVSLSEDIAIGISRGRHPKGYSTLDANEDAVAAAGAGGGALLAVADGHWGFDAARAALEAVHRLSYDLLQLAPAEAVGEAMNAAALAVRTVHEVIPEDRRHSKTTLTVAIVRDGTGAVGGFGDSKAVLLGRQRPRVLWSAAPFLGPSTNVSEAWFEADIDVTDKRLAVASDGLLDFFGHDWPQQLASMAALEPRQYVASAIERAFDGGAGDHISVAVADF